jgi:hypothetical protein
MKKINEMNVRCWGTDLEESMERGDAAMRRLKKL